MGLVKSTLDEGAKAMNSLVDAQRELRQSPGNRIDIMENLLHRNVFGAIDMEHHIVICCILLYCILLFRIALYRETHDS